MKTPWTRKNPWMSLWMSAAHAAAGTVRGKAAAQGRRQANAAMQRGIEQAVGLWSGGLLAPPASRRRRRR